MKPEIKIFAMVSAMFAAIFVSGLLNVARAEECYENCCCDSLGDAQAMCSPNHASFPETAHCHFKEVAAADTNANQDNQTDTSDNSGDLVIENPLGAGTTLTDIIGKLIDFLLTVALIICPLMIVVGGFFYITAAGDPAKANKGRQVMVYAAIGLVIILISKGLVVAVQKAIGAI